MLARLLLLAGGGGAGGGISLMSQSARIYRSTIQGIPNTTWTPMSFDTILWDNDGCVNIAAHPTRLTCQTAGIYIVIGQFSFSTSGTTSGGPALFLNGTTYYGSATFGSLAAGFSGSVATLVNLVVGDYMELNVYQNSGGSLNTIADPYDGCNLMWARLA